MKPAFGKVLVRYNPPGYIGFAVGRTTFWDAVQGWRDKKLERKEAVGRIAANYREWVDIFEKAA